MNRAEAKIAVRDLILANVLNATIGEDVGKAYLEALKEADSQVEQALAKREQLGP